MKQKIPTVLGVFFVLSGCAQLYEPKPVVTPVTENTMVTRTSSITHTYVLDRNSKYFTCTEPLPDAAFSQGESGSTSISILNFGSSPEKASESDNSEELEMTGRTPGVLMTRELFFRLCEFSRNYRLTKEEAKAMYLKTLDTVNEGWKSESARTTVNIGETESHTINQTFTGDAPAVSGVSSGSSSGYPTIPDSGGSSSGSEDGQYSSEVIDDSTASQSSSNGGSGAF